MNYHLHPKLATNDFQRVNGQNPKTHLLLAKTVEPNLVLHSYCMIQTKHPYLYLKQIAIV